MTWFFLLPFAAGFYSLLLAVLSLLRRQQSFAGWCFVVGMAALGLDSLFTGLSLRATQFGDVVEWLTPAFIAKSFVPVTWLFFSLTYSRSNYREFLTHWKIPLVVLGLLPVGVSLGALQQSLSRGTSSDLWWLQSGGMATTLNLILLVALVLILMNLEQTLRSAVGTMRWRIKFVVVALALIFGARLYVRSQAILFSAPDIALWSVESGALLIGCFFLTVAYARTRLAEIDVYPSQAVLRSSLTVLVVGAYLFVVGILAHVVSRFGGAEIFQFQVVVVIVGMGGLAVVLLSDRVRQKLHVFSVRHFSKSQHDSVRIWTLFSKRIANVQNQAGVCAESARLISETFDVLSVTIWLLDQGTGRLAACASTAHLGQESEQGEWAGTLSPAVNAALQTRPSPFDLENVSEAWADELRRRNPATFPNGGNRLCVPLRSAEKNLGAIVLADRVSGAVYTLEQLELLTCIAEQVASVVINLRLAAEAAQARELEAFRTMSAFFVHDLKNAAASLNLTLRNLPVHFDNPAFREDALRGIGNTASRIDGMIARLAALRERPHLTLVEADLNRLVNEAVDSVSEMTEVEVTKELRRIPSVLADRDQIRSVVTNLVLNAREAVGASGRIEVRTDRRDGHVVLSVTDNGCGMSPAFVRESLFRPFQSTKRKGLGIGLFQARAIVQAHGGGIHVETEPGRGTTFLVTLPAQEQS